MILRLSSLKQQRHLLSFMILCVGCAQAGHFFYTWHLLEVSSHRTEWQHLRFILLQAADTGWYVGIPLELVLLHKVSSWDQSFLQCGGLVTKGECSRNVKVEAPDLLNSIYGPYFLFFYSSVVKGGHRTSPNSGGKKTTSSFSWCSTTGLSAILILLTMFSFACTFFQVCIQMSPLQRGQFWPYTQNTFYFLNIILILSKLPTVCPICWFACLLSPYA